MARVLLCAVLAGGCGAQAVNGCDPAEAVDATGRSEVEIGFGGVHGYHYTPACVRVSAGTRVRFAGPFEVHPLGGGRFEEGELVPEERDTPFADVATGDESGVVLETPGAYGFYCHYHAVEGMVGAVFVE